MGGSSTKESATEEESIVYKEIIEKFESKRRTHFANVAVIDARNLISKDAYKNYVIVDVRCQYEMDVSTIPGAVSLDSFQKSPPPENQKIVFHCVMGGRAGAAAKNYIDAHPDMAANVLVMKGSLCAWTHLGGKLVDEAGNATKRVHSGSAENVALFPTEKYEIVSEQPEQTSPEIPIVSKRNSQKSKKSEDKSPAKRDSTKEESPVKCCSQKEESPVKRGSQKEESPVKCGSQKEESPVKRGSQKEESPVKRGSQKEDAKSPTKKEKRVSQANRELYGEAKSWFDQVIFPAQTGVTQIEVEELLQGDAYKEYVMVDTRTLEERNISVIPGSVPIDDFLAKERPRDKKIVFYCTVGGRSGTAAAEYVKYNTEVASNVANFKLSILAWCHANGPLVDARGIATNKVHSMGEPVAQRFPTGGLYEVVYEPAAVTKPLQNFAAHKSDKSPQKRGSQTKGEDQSPARQKEVDSTPANEASEQKTTSPDKEAASPKKQAQSPQKEASSPGKKTAQDSQAKDNENKGQGKGRGKGKGKGRGKGKKGKGGKAQDWGAGSQDWGAGSQGWGAQSQDWGAGSQGWGAQSQDWGAQSQDWN